MDKRSIIFVIVLATTFFLINQWFAPDTSQLKKQVEEAQDEEVKLSNLDLEKLFSASDDNAFIAYAFNVSGQHLAIAWKSDLPKKVFIKKEGKFEEAQLLSSRYKKDEPVLFGNEDEKIYFADPAAKRAILISFNAAFDPEIASAKIQSGQLSFEKGRPSRNGLVLVKKDGKYEPAAFFEQSKNLMHPLEEYYSIANLSEVAPDEIETKEEFYLLENGYMQVLFSTLGGAVAEINLPFKNPKISGSVVNEIEADRLIAEKSPNNDIFPGNPFYYLDKEGKKQKEEKGVTGGYYPLLRRSLYRGEDGRKSKFSPRHYAFNLISENSDEVDSYKVTKFTENSIEFTLSSSQKHIVKNFTLKDEPYCLELNTKVEGSSRSIWMTSGIPEVELILESFSPNLKYMTTKAGKKVSEQIDLPKTYLESSSATMDWISTSNGFFGLIMESLSGKELGYKVKYVKGSEIPTRLSIIDPEYNLYPPEKFPGYEVLLPFRQLPHDMTFRLFSGPLDDKILKELDKKFTVEGKSPQFIEVKGTSGFLNSISEPFSKVLYILLKFFYLITHSWGLAILLLTIALRIVLYPLNNWSIKSQSRMQAVAPKIKEIQDRYKKDPKKAQIEIMKTYRENGGNPLAGGCLPMLIQIPILFGMFLLLKSSFELRGQGFIPYWIENLASPDILFSWSYPIPFIGTQFHLLPFLLGAATYLQQKLFSKLPKDKKLMTDQQKQQALMGNIMGVMLIFIFYKLPSGLNIYYLFSTVLGLLQQWMITKKAKI